MNTALAPCPVEELATSGQEPQVVHYATCHDPLLTLCNLRIECVEVQFSELPQQYPLCSLCFLAAEEGSPCPPAHRCTCTSSGT